MNNNENIIETGKRFLNYKIYKNEIDKILNQYASLLTDNFHGLQHSKVKLTFWDIVNGKPYHNSDIYVNYVFSITRIISFEIMKIEKKISHQVYQIINEWYSYLINRLSGYATQLTEKFLHNFSSDIHIDKLENMYELCKESLYSFERNDLKLILIDTSKTPTEKIIIFKDQFFKLYSIFKIKCEELGKHLSMFEGCKGYGDDLRKIFHIGGQNDALAPTLLVNNVLDALIHVRNAISHPDKAGIIEIDSEKVRITDYNGTKKTFDQEFTYQELWVLYYEMQVFDVVLKDIALILLVFKRAHDLNQKFTKNVICSNCGYERPYYLPPEVKQFRCRNCNKFLMNPGINDRN